MNFLIKITIFYFILSILIIIYKDLPFSKITLRKNFPYFFISIFLLSFLPFYFYYEGFSNCDFRCFVLGSIPLENKIFLIPLFSFLLFLLLLIKNLVKEWKYKKLPLIIFGKNKEGVSVKGALKPFIYIDRNLWNTLSKKEKKIILLHEINHIKEKDAFFKLILELLSKTFFYLPHLFLLRKVFKEISELASDEYSLIKTQEKEEIIKTIAKLALEINSNSFSGFASSSILKRIESIRKERKNKIKIFFLLIPLSALLVNLLYLTPFKQNCEIKCGSSKMCKNLHEF